MSVNDKISLLFILGIVLIGLFIVFAVIFDIRILAVFGAVILSLIFIYIFPEFGLAGSITFSLLFPSIVAAAGIEEATAFYFARLGIIFLSFLIYLFRKRKTKLLPGLSLTTIFFTIFFIYYVTGVFYTPLKEVGMSRVAVFAYHTLFPFYLLLFIERETALKIFRWTFIIASLLAFLTLCFPTWTPYKERASLIGKGLITYGRFYGLSALLGIESYFYEKRRTIRYFYLISLVFIAISLFLTGTRGALVSLVAGLLFYFFFFAPLSIMKKGFILLLLLIGVVGIITLGHKGIAKYRILAIAVIDASVYLRLVMWKEAFKVFIENPITGIGTGGFSVNLGQFLLGNYPHNIIIEILAELGLIGLILFIGFLWGVIKNIIFLVKHSDDSKTKRITGLCLSLIVYTFISAMFSSTIGENKEFFILAAMLEAITIEKKGEIKYGTSVL